MQQRDDDDTPRERLIVRRPPSSAELASSASNHPRVKVARVWQATIVTVVTTAVVGALAALQSWPPELTLGALGAATGLFAFTALKR